MTERGKSIDNPFEVTPRTLPELVTQLDSMLGSLIPDLNAHEQIDEVSRRRTTPGITVDLPSFHIMRNNTPDGTSFDIQPKTSSRAYLTYDIGKDERSLTMSTRLVPTEDNLRAQSTTVSIEIFTHPFHTAYLEKIDQVVPLTLTIPPPETPVGTFLPKTVEHEGDSPFEPEDQNAVNEIVTEVRKFMNPVLTEAANAPELNT